MDKNAVCPPGLVAGDAATAPRRNRPALSPPTTSRPTLPPRPSHAPQAVVVKVGGFRKQDTCCLPPPVCLLLRCAALRRVAPHIAFCRRGCAARRPGLAAALAASGCRASPEPTGDARGRVPSGPTPSLYTGKKHACWVGSRDPLAPP